MGQYHLTCNLDKKEFLHPHKLGEGLKLMEQIDGQGGVASALFILLATSNGRGLGDFPNFTEYTWEGEKYEHNLVQKVTDETMHALANKYIGRWAGDRIAVVGDYSEDEDLPKDCVASKIYRWCCYEENGWKDITDGILPLVERICGVKISGVGCRKKTGGRESHLCPDLVIAVNKPDEVKPEEAKPEEVKTNDV